MTNPQKEHPSAYFVQDRSNLEEMANLEIQDKMLNIMVSGILPEIADHSSLRRVLDVGCGTGGWLMETAREYPTIEKLIGVDVSLTMIAYARAKTSAEALDERIEFQTMDALRIVEFPNAFFDLVNQRFGFSWLRTWEWKKILMEYQRVCTPSGIIRITEPNLNVESNSPALTTLYDIALETSYRSGRLFEAEGTGVTSELVRLMTLHGIENVQSHLHTLVYSRGTETGQSFYEDVVRFFRVALPFFGKWTRVSANYQEIYQQALIEMQEPGFVATMTLVTAWGTRREDGIIPRMRGLRWGHAI